MYDLVPRGACSGGQSVETEYHQVFSDGVWTTNYVYEDNVYAEEARITQGYNIKNFRKLMREGALLPQTPFSQVYTKGSSEGAYYIALNGDPLGRRTAPCVMYPNWRVDQGTLSDLLPPSSDIYVQAAAAAIYTSGHDTLTFLAELADTKRLFIRFAQTMLTRNIPKTLYKVSCEWLSVRYGWRTLLYDLKDLDKAVRNYGKKRARYSETRGQHWTETSTSTWESIPGTGRVYQFQLSDYITRGIRGSVVADIAVPAFQFNPLVTAWEFIPYSFVVDWVLSVGKALAAISFLGLHPSYAASIGRSVEIDRSFTHWCDFSQGYSGTSVQTGESHSEYVVRSPSTVNFTPHLTLKVNALKIIDLVALIIQKL